MIAGQDHDVLRALFFERVDVLVDGVGRALVPVLVDPLLRRHDVDELAQFAAEIASPAQVDVPIEAHGLVLRQHQHLADAAVQAVGEREIDNAIGAAKGHGRLGPVARQRLQTGTFATGQNYGQNAIHAESLPALSASRWVGTRIV